MSFFNVINKPFCNMLEQYVSCKESDRIALFMKFSIKLFCAIRFECFFRIFKSSHGLIIRISCKHMMKCRICREILWIFLFIKRKIMQKVNRFRVFIKHRVKCFSSKCIRNNYNNIIVRCHLKFICTRVP